MTREVPAVAFRALKMVVKSVTSDHEQSAVRRTNAVTHGQLVVHREEPNAISLGFLGLCSICVNVEVPSRSRLALHLGAGHRHEAEGSQRSSVIRTSVGGLAAVADFFHHSCSDGVKIKETQSPALVGERPRGERIPC